MPVNPKEKWIGAIELRLYNLYRQVKALAPRNRAERRSRKGEAEGLRLEARINENRWLLSILTAGEAADEASK